ncbi:OmpA family protein [Stutzerimonas stutzeri]|uniref:OmpA family protein n=1 Tax=Stutzerimonas stutzeri TaxID=316 RepID=UPI00300E8D60
MNMRFFLVMAALALAGCSSQDTEHELAQASAALERIQADGMVQRGAPKDLHRALETLQRAERFNDYWGGAEDARHYAYLSRRYSEIAAQQGELLQHQEQVARLEMERDRLRRMLQDAQLMTAEQQGRWLEDQMMSLAASETDRGLVMTLGDVLFHPDSAELGNSANRTLLKLVHFLQLNPQRKVRIEGYSDSRGDPQANLELSRARAQTVADLLISLGIEAGRVEVRGYGERFPIAENASARGRAQNRRVEILFSDAAGNLGPDR